MKELKDRDIVSIRSMLIDKSDGFFGPSEEDSLRCVVRLVATFKYSLLGANGFSCVDDVELQYNIESIFSAIDNYVILWRGYYLVDGALNGSMYDTVSINFLRKEFDGKYEALCSTSDFVYGYRLLLDLYGILIIVGGLCYNQMQRPVKGSEPTDEPKK